ncbi:hypothetical protein BJ165DRAFT_1398000 [Panaeolus papilionaceus]|nr:hypothetical protein BJ165DRAFT_1398000 [Panaeolus papilionaceus]
MSNANGNRGRFLAKLTISPRITLSNPVTLPQSPRNSSPNILPQQSHLQPPAVAPHHYLGSASSMDQATQIPNTAKLEVQSGSCANATHLLGSGDTPRSAPTQGVPLVQTAFPSAFRPPIVRTPGFEGSHLSSHITDVFTSQTAREEEMRVQNRLQESLRLAAQRKINQTVSVYAWTDDNEVAPEPHEIQDEFAWPNFVLNKALLACVGLTVTQGIIFGSYKVSLRHWSQDVSSDRRIFIKARGLTRCHGLDALVIETTPAASSPSLRRRLPSERNYIKECLASLELSVGLQQSPTKPFYTPKKRSRPVAEDASSDDELDHTPTHRTFSQANRAPATEQRSIGYVYIH